MEDHKRFRGLAERWDRQDALECIRFGRIIPVSHHVDIALRIALLASLPDCLQACLAVDYLRGLKNV